MVRGIVEETLNALLDAEADQLCGAGRYERSQARQDTRAGSYERTLQTSAGEVNLKVPKLRSWRWALHSRSASASSSAFNVSSTVPRTTAQQGNADSQGCRRGVGRN